MGFCLSPQHTSIQAKIKGSARSEWVFVCLPSTLAFRPRLKDVLGVSGFLFVSPAH